MAPEITPAPRQVTEDLFGMAEGGASRLWHALPEAARCLAKTDFVHARQAPLAASATAMPACCSGDARSMKDFEGAAKRLRRGFRRASRESGVVRSADCRSRNGAVGRQWAGMRRRRCSRRWWRATGAVGFGSAIGLREGFWLPDSSVNRTPPGYAGGGDGLLDRRIGSSVSAAREGAAAARFRSESSGTSSTLGNSHRCAFTTPAGRWRTSKRPRRSATKATKRRGVARMRRRGQAVPPRGPPVGDAMGSRSGRRRTGVVAGVQISAPSSISDWFNWAQERECETCCVVRWCEGFCGFVLAACSTSSSASCQRRALVLRSRGSPAMPYSRVRTRMTLPSRIGGGLIEGDAADGPGGVAADTRQRQHVVEVVAGTCPPCLRQMSCAARCRLRTRV